MATTEPVTPEYWANTFIYDTTTPATLTSIGEGGRIPVCQFDYGTTEEVQCIGFIGDNYSDGGLTIKLFVAADSAITDATIRLDVKIRRYQAGIVIPTDTTWGTTVSASLSVDTAWGEFLEVTVTLADGAETDNLAKNEGFIISIQHDHDHAGSGIDAPFNLMYFYILET
jgi:hypothetical protein